MATTWDKWEGRWTVPADTHGMTIDATSKYVAAGDYYWGSGCDGGSSLASAIATAISLVVGSTTCTVDDSTGLLTIHFGSGNHTITWLSTTLRNMCGFASNCTPADHTFTGTKQVQRLWLPNLPAADYEGAIGSMGKRIYDRRITPCRNGAQWSRLGSDWYERNYSYRAIAVEKIWEGSESVVNESFESFLEDCFLSNPARHYTDRTDDTSYLVNGSTAREYVLGEFGEYNPRRTSKVDDLWDLSFHVRQNIED